MIDRFPANRPDRTVTLNQKGGGESNRPRQIAIRFRQNDGRSTGCSRPAAGDDATFALRTLAGELANTTNSFSLFAGALLRRLFVVVAHLHFTENAFALHLFLKSAERLINIVVANQYLHVNPVPYLVLKPGMARIPEKQFAFAWPKDTRLVERTTRSLVPSPVPTLHFAANLLHSVANPAVPDFRPMAEAHRAASQKRRCQRRIFAICLKNDMSTSPLDTEFPSDAQIFSFRHRPRGPARPYGLGKAVDFA
jgi:hypothetical protein